MSVVCVVYRSMGGQDTAGLGFTMTAGSSLARNQSVFLPVITSTELYNMLLKRPLLSRGYQTAVELL